MITNRRTAPRLRRTGPRPKPGTVRLTALCSKCDGVLYRPPLTGVEWIHDVSGTDQCDEAGWDGS